MESEAYLLKNGSSLALERCLRHLLLNAPQSAPNLHETRTKTHKHNENVQKPNDTKYKQKQLQKRGKRNRTQYLQRKTMPKQTLKLGPFWT